MRFDIIIIGGGLSGLTSGLHLASQGRKVSIVSSGQSSLHYSGGSLELLGYVNGREVTHPLEAISELPDDHPYRRIGVDKIRQYEHTLWRLLAAARIRGGGTCERNHWRLTPFGAMRPAWLTLGDYPMFEQPRVTQWSHVMLLGIRGFIDFYPQYLQYALSKMGVQSAIDTLDLKGLQPLRLNGTECRATTIARVLDNDPTLLRQMASAINERALGSEAVIMPDVFGVQDNMCIEALRTLVEKPLWCVTTMPVSVGGLRSQIMLRRRFEYLGGTFLMGDKVLRADIRGHEVEGIYTANFGPERLEASHYILASGSMVSGGIVAGPERIIEPIFNLDVLHADEMPHQRAAADVFAPQPFMQCGVGTDGDFHPLSHGTAMSNLWATGAVLGGLNPIVNGTGGGVAVLTAIDVAEKILKL